MKCSKCKSIIYLRKLNGLCHDCLEPRQLKKRRNEVFLKDNFTCQECGKKEGCQLPEEEYNNLPEEKKWEVKWMGLELHHIKPTYLGGNDKIDNLITLCVDCHKKYRKRKITPTNP